MDSVEKMRRLNELTKELKQRGFAESSFEAIQQANQIYGDDDVSSEVMHGIIQNSPQERIAKDEGKNMDDAAVINMDKKVAKLSENIDLLTNKLNEIIKAINDMDSRINSLKNRPERVVEKVVEKPEPVKKEPEAEHKHVETKAAGAETSAADATETKDEYSTNQRVGNYKSTDVAIDKMFYYGKK